MFSEELALLRPDWLCPEESEPEQLWVLSRGRHSSETHFLLPMESEDVEEFDVNSVDLFLLRKCLLRREKERLKYFGLHKQRSLLPALRANNSTGGAYLKIGVFCG